MAYFEVFFDWCMTINRWKSTAFWKKNYWYIKKDTGLYLEPKGFYVIDFMPENTKYNSEYFIKSFLSQIFFKKWNLEKFNEKKKLDSFR